MKLPNSLKKLLKLQAIPLPRLWLFVGLPTFITFIYLSFFATDVYTSESQFIIKQSNAHLTPMTLGIPFLNPQTSTSQEDALILRDYTESTNLLNALNANLNLIEHYQEPSIDWWSRLPNDSSLENTLEYMKRYFSFDLDPESSIVTLKTSSFEPEFSYELNKAIIQYYENFINEISLSLAQAQVSFVEEELEKAETKLAKARATTLAFQAKYNLLDPESESASLFGRISALEAQLSAKETEYKTLSSFLQEDSPRIVKIQKEIGALKEQIEEETRSLAGGEERSLNQIMAEYQDLRIDQEFALNTYKSALSTLESARTDASRQIKFLVMISDTGVPSETSHPKPFEGSLTVFVLSLLIFLVLRLVVATINDHRD